MFDGCFVFCLTTIYFEHSTSKPNKETPEKSYLCHCVACCAFDPSNIVSLLGIRLFLVCRFVVRIIGSVEASLCVIVILFCVSSDMSSHCWVVQISIARKCDSLGMISRLSLSLYISMTCANLPSHILQCGTRCHCTNPTKQQSTPLVTQKALIADSSLPTMMT